MSLFGGLSYAQSGGDVIDLAEEVTRPAIPVCPDARWPGEDWPDDTVVVRRDHGDRVAALDAWLFDPDLDWADKDRVGVRSDGVLIVHRGAVVYERYREPWTPDTPHLTWSATKSFLNTLVGVAVGEGRLQLSDSICDHLRPGREIPEASCAVTVQNLLDMASGFEWRETYEGMSPTASSVLAMLYGEGSLDMASFVAGQALVREPGAAWQYSSGDSTLLAAVVGAALEPVHGERFPWKVLLDRIGMTTATWERDASGTYVGSSYLWATPRDLARFGYLMLHDGCWQGEPVLPRGWVDFSLELPESIQREAIPELGEIAQARLFWVNRKLPGMDHSWCPDAPPAMFAALGHWGQSITMVPEHDLIIVRMADDRDGNYIHNETVKRALDLVRELP